MNIIIGNKPYVLSNDVINEIPFISKLITNKTSFSENKDTIPNILKDMETLYFDAIFKYAKTLRPKYFFTTIEPSLLNPIKLVELLDMLSIDIEIPSLDEISEQIRDIHDEYTKVCRRTYEISHYSNKSGARDAAAELIIGMIKNKFDDRNKVYNLVFFIISHPNTFPIRIRTHILKIFKEGFVVTKKQQNILDDWWNKCYCNDDTDTSSEEESSYEYNSDFD